MKRWVISITIIAVVIYVVRYLPADHEQYAQDREEAARSQSPDRDLVVAVVWPEDRLTSFVRGADLAAEEIEKAGGIAFRRNGPKFRHLRLRKFNESDHQAGIAIARLIAAETDIVAVVGHEVSNDSVVNASAIYNSSGTLFIVPTSIDEAVTAHGFRNVFRLAPTVSKVGQAMVDSAARLAERQQIRVAILYPEGLKPATSDDGAEKGVDQRLVLSANSVLDRHGISLEFSVVLVHEYKRGKDDYYADIEPLLSRPDLYDVVLILDVMPGAANVRRDLELGLEARAEGEAGHGKRILDLDQLDWTLGELSYADLGQQVPSMSATEPAPQTDGQNPVPIAESDRSGGDVLFDRAAELVLRETKQSVAILAQRDRYNTFYGIQLSTEILESLHSRASGIRSGDELENRLRLKMFRTYEQPLESKRHAGEPALVKRATPPAEPDYSALVLEVLESQVEFVFIAGMGESAVRLIKELRRAGLTTPIICGPHLEYQVLWKMEEPKERGNTYVVSAFDPGGASQVARSFVAAYKTRYNGDEPDALAAAGYESIKLLEDAFRRAGSESKEEAGSTSLREVTSTLLFSKDLDEEPFGKPRFSQNGDLQGVRLLLKTRDAADSVKVIHLETSYP